MNNSYIAIQSASLEEKVDILPNLRSEEEKLIKIIQAIDAVAASPEWQILKLNVFDGVVDSLERQKAIETSKQPINVDKVHSLNGQLAWAKKYSNFTTLSEAYRLRLREIKEKLNAKTRNGAS